MLKSPHKLYLYKNEMSIIIVKLIANCNVWKKTISHVGRTIKKILQKTSVNSPRYGCSIVIPA